MAGTSSSPICIDPSSSPGSGCENLTLSPAKSPLKVVKLRGQEYRRVLSELSEESDSEVAEVVEPADRPRRQLFSGAETSSTSEDGVCKPRNVNTPVFDVPISQYSVEKIISMMLEPCAKSLICSERPTDIHSSATFVIDLEKLQHPDDAKRDNFGKWNPSGSHTVPFKAWYNEEGDVEIERLPSHTSGPDVQYLRRMHYIHPSDSRCKRMLAFITDTSGELHHLCVASYRFPKGVLPKATPHGNSKSNIPFHPTWSSAMERIKKEARTHGPKETVSRASSASGGMMQASSAGQLPRNEHQVSNVRHLSKKTTGPCAGDELFIAMSECKSKDVTARFVRDVKAAPEPAVVLATDQQLEDLVRFCTSAEEFCVATVDPTFSLGEFEVTPLTYRHLMLKTSRTGKQPVFMGPLLIHFRKSFSTFLYFASTLVGLCRDLDKLKAFGTDGEEALVDAFSHEFGFAVHLTCAIHLRRNVKQQLQDRKFPEQHRRTTLDEIFGARRGSVYLEGLIDANSCKEFDDKLASLESVWKARESSDPCCTAGFFEWFQKYKADVLKCSAIRPVREEAGLGNPPEMFTTNASESLNAVIKSKVDYQKNELNKFIEKMRCLVDDQQKEVERAVCRRGKYTFRSNYQFLEVNVDRWFAMTPEARSKHMAKVHHQVVVPNIAPCGSPGNEPESSPLQSTSCNEVGVLTMDSSGGLSVEFATFADNVTTPTAVLEGIWKKAAELLSDPHKLVPAPGCSPLARMVASKTGRRPHLVTPGKDGRFACDSDCPNFKCFGICSHVVAVAEVNHKLPAFINLFEKQKKVPNLSSLAKDGMPKGRGRKGGLPPRKRMKSAAPEKRVPFDLVATASLPDTSHLSGTQGICSVPSQDAFYPLGEPSFPPAVQAGLYNPQANVYNPTIHTSVYPPHPQAGYFPSAPLSSPPFQQSSVNTQSGILNIMASQVGQQPITTAVSDQTPFKLHFISGNISRCAGCKGKYSKPALPPNNLCVQHEEWRQITYPNSPSPSTIFSNSYYHPNLRCIRVNWPHFVPSDLVIPPTVRAELRPEHWATLMSAFGALH